ncbi:FUSC family protein [Neobacillus jeddahensis]|uniref:FUSC family protein n=1 Tax=Neobacillus jeddahensis TaxID=1461580 RepID=UPI0006937CAE|nr:FUSC family protein [Neobacillus jeddahensis]
MKQEQPNQMKNKTVLIWKMGLASALSWELAKLAGSDHPYLAAVSVILCLQTTINRSIQFSYHRMVGTVIGICVVVLLEPYLIVNGWTLGLLILIGGFLTKWLKHDETAIHQVALTVLLVFVMGHKSSDYPIDRFRDTLMGALVAVVIHIIVRPPTYTNEALQRIHQFSISLSTSLQNVARWIRMGLDASTGEQIYSQLKGLKHEIHQVNSVLQEATDSLQYNLLGKKKAIQLQKAKLHWELLVEELSYLSSSVDTLKAWSEAGTMNTFEQTRWADQFTVIGQLVKENPASTQVEIDHYVTISLPEEMKNQQYPLSLYNETILFLKKRIQSS